MADFAAIFEKAKAAGLAAGNGASPAAMVVAQHANPLNDASVVTKAWYVADGACGFAWVNVAPGTAAFAKWLVKNGKGRKAYRTGIDIWVSEHGQSAERKDAHARAMAEVLRAALPDLKIYADGRLD